jgi:hypothetical protein
VETQLTLVEEEHGRFLEGPVDKPLMQRVEDVDSILEQCISRGASALLLYTPNLTGGFFDLSSGEAGAILQKLFQYRVRLAIVCEPGTVRPESRFSDVLVEEVHRDRLAVFATADSARNWIAPHP